MTPTPLPIPARVKAVQDAASRVGEFSDSTIVLSYSHSAATGEVDEPPIIIAAAGNQGMHLAMLSTAMMQMQAAMTCQMVMGALREGPGTATPQTDPSEDDDDDGDSEEAHPCT